MHDSAHSPSEVNTGDTGAPQELCHEHPITAQSSLCKNLQADVSHRSCVTDNVASTGEEEVQVSAQLPTAAEIERYLGTAAAFFW